MLPPLKKTTATAIPYLPPRTTTHHNPPNQRLRPPGVLHADGHPSPAGSDEHSAPFGVGGSIDPPEGPMVFSDGFSDVKDLYIYVIPILVKMV